MSSYIIYHPKRMDRVFDGTKVYFDNPEGNQDPYVWNENFLHSFCHITELKNPEVGDIMFWVSGDVFPDFNVLLCDLVFVVQQKCEWRNRNRILPTDPIVESVQAYNDHYQWAFQHMLKKRRRFTLKADPNKSFQAQDANMCLINILPEISRLGLDLADVRRRMKKGYASKPMRIENDIAKRLLSFLEVRSDIKLRGAQLRIIRDATESLASPCPRAKRVNER